MITLAVVYGGMSSEHSISCISAGAIMAELPQDSFEIFPVGITQDGVWVQGSIDPVGDSTLPSVTEGREIALSVNPQRRGEFYDAQTGEVLATVDVVFPVLHGTYGEDGTIQGLLEMAGVPYVGTGVLSSACSMDKEFTKAITRAAGIPVTREVILHDGSESDAIGNKEREYLGLPVFVKPARGGSSIGITKVDAWEDLADAVRMARLYDSKVIVEAELIGDEVEVGVLELPNGELVASPPAKLNGTADSEEGFYGFETKYLDNVVTATIPAGYDDVLNEQLAELAIRTFKALDCRGLARVDFFVTEDGPMLNEVNTMPGFTSISMFPQVFQAVGMSYSELLTTLITSALERAK
ncbi:D-alanine--D-alanine ligase family protein [Corynebacterium meitnerae]|uniref:D-alanine--D-alanine ligase n=1 Tax=Corynebacterium meitnerae TaxID=2913498 RepID=A0A9X3RKH6_9CORY|nr:D-alanine--D-alanine ligase family protein [Corynebacterium meitnerae]MCZ9292893.1 D-alanine--D-alanine ligase [Corynebacterium meitnerae]